MKKWKKMLTSACVIIAAAVGIAAFPMRTSAAEYYLRRDTVAEEERVQAAFSDSKTDTKKTDPKAWKKINGICYNGSGKKIQGAITWGMDVSEWQGNINWSKVKKSGIDFAFVRISYGVGYLDKTYGANMKKANAAGVPVGTYVYSLATTTKQALKEAQLAIEKMKGYKVSYPVVFDLESPQMGKLSDSQVSRLALTFCNEVRKAGYYPMVYCNAYWYNNHIDWNLLNGIDVWIASYGDTILAPSHDDYKYTIWQSTDGDGGGLLNPTKGLVDGVPASNNIDVDFGYVDYTKVIVPRTEPVSGYVPAELPDYSADGENTSDRTGWETVDDQTCYYFNGEKVTGWKKIEGKYYYFDPDTAILWKDQLITTEDNCIYYVDKEGVRAESQWVNYNGKTYYMASDGCAVKYLRKIDGKYYYFNSQKGYMYKKRKIIRSNGDIYYLGSDGAAYTEGFLKLKENGNTNTYYFGRNGKAHKGWLTLKGKSYYFYKGKSQKSGTRAENITLTSSNNVVSVFDKNGVCVKQYRI